MSDLTSETMWTEFSALWNDLSNCDKSLLLAGGYGLFLKQQWLIHHLEVPTIIPLNKWLDTTPRATRDMDFVIGVELIADLNKQREVNSLLKERGYESLRPSGMRWKFERQNHIVELHCAPPETSMDGIEVKGIRVKHKPSLGDEGIHAYCNPQAIGSDSNPFNFELNEVSIAVPNPLTWCVMKLAAMRDRWSEAINVELPVETRRTQQAQSIKHGQDICRIVAMITRDENDALDTMLTLLNGKDVFIDATRIYREFLLDHTHPVRAEIARNWQEEDFQQIMVELGSWFK